MELTPQHTPELTVEQCCKWLFSQLKVRGIEKCQLIGIGVGTIGPINIEEGTMGIILNFPTNGWIMFQSEI